MSSSSSLGSRINVMDASQHIDFEKVWERIAAGVFNVMKLQEGTPGMPIIEGVYVLCTANPKGFSQEVYASLKAVITRFVTKTIKPLHKITLSDVIGCRELLFSYAVQWKRFVTGAKCVNNLFGYLNSHWIDAQLSISDSKKKSTMRPSTPMEFLYPVIQRHPSVGTSAQSKSKAHPSVPTRPLSREKNPSPIESRGSPVKAKHVSSKFSFLFSHSVESDQIYPVDVMCLRVWVEHAYIPLRDSLHNAFTTLVNAKRSNSFLLCGAQCSTPPQLLSAPVSPSPDPMEDLPGCAGGSSDMVALLAYIDSFVTLGARIYPCDSMLFYHMEGEGIYFSKLRSLCEIQSEQLISKLGFAPYLTAASTMMKEELALGQSILNRSSHAGLASLLYDCLVIRHISRIKDELPGLLESNNSASLKELFQLVNMKAVESNGFDLDSFNEELRRHSIEILAKSFEDWLIQFATKQLSQEFTTLTQESADAVISIPVVVGYAEHVIGLYRHFLNVVTSCFENHPQFVAAFDYSARVFLNAGDCQNAMQIDGTDHSRLPEIIARYTDLFLNTGSRNRQHALQISKFSKILGDGPSAKDEWDSFLSDIVNVFRLIRDQDMFVHFYSRLMERRLVTQCSLSVESEAAIVRGIMKNSEAERVIKMGRMINDIESVEQCNKDFAKYCSRRKLKLSLDPPSHFSIHVLSARFWTSLAVFNTHVTMCNSIYDFLPSKIRHCEELFSQFYVEVHTGRKLLWHHEHTRATFSAKFCAQNFNLDSNNILQSYILLSFNERDEWTASALCKDVIPEAQMVLCLQQLCKLRIIKRAENDVYSLNSSFVPPKRKLTLPPFTGQRKSVSSVNPNGEGTNACEEDEHEADYTESKRDTTRERMDKIESVIVRVMKGKKVASQPDLTSAVIEVCSKTPLFTFREPIYRAALDDLVEKGYLSKSKDIPPTYCYIP